MLYWLSYLGRKLQDASLFIYNKLAAFPPDVGMPTQPQRKLKAVPALQVKAVFVVISKSQYLCQTAAAASEAGVAYAVQAWTTV